MNYISICSGIEAASQAFLPLGWKPVFFAETEPFPCAVLKYHHPNTPNYGDITKFKEWPQHGAIQLCVGGTPCQSFSVAGLRKGIADPRGNLALVFLGIVDKYRPTWVLWENVPGVHSSWSDATNRGATESALEAGRTAERQALDAGFDPATAELFGKFEEVDQSSDFDCFLSGLAELGYGVATTILDAQFFGLAQRRERVFVVGHIGGQWQRAAAVLFDGSCVRGDSAPRRETGQGTAEATSKCLASCSGGIDREDRHTVIPIQEIGTFQNTGQGWWNGEPVAQTLRDSSAGGASHANVITHSLRADGFDASEDGTGRGTPLVPEISPPLRAGGNETGGDRPHGTDVDTCESLIPSVARALQERDSKGSDSSTKDGHLLPVAFDTTQITSSGNYSNPKPGDPCHPIAESAHPPAVAFTQNQAGDVLTGDVAASISTNGNASGRNTAKALAGYAVRRLTPVECERLQGFPDGYTDVRKPTPDGPRYKALGNSFAVPVVAWLGRRIMELHV